MVKEVEKQAKKFYQCEVCRLVYENKEIAKKCEKWCKGNNSCNLKITKYAIKGFKGGESR